MNFKKLRYKIMSPFSKRVKNKLTDIQNKEYLENFKLIMTLLVKDEEDIIEKNIRFHSAMGVDGFIVTNHNSTDKTNEILGRLKDEGLVLEIIYKTTPKHEHSIWVTEMIYLAKTKYNATWVINADADEFYYSKSLDLKKSIQSVPHANLLWVDSIFSFPSEEKNIFNSFYFVTNPPMLQEIDFLDKILSEEENLIYSDVLTYIGRKRNCPKVIHNTEDFIKIYDGNHHAIMKNEIRVECADIKLFHYNKTSYSRLEKKVQRWAESAFLMPSEQRYLRKLLNSYKDGSLIKKYKEQYSQERRTFLIDKGIVSIDKSVSNFLKYKDI